MGPFLGSSIPKRAAEKGLVEYHLTNFRDFATDAHKSVDDKPFGGGPGMLMMCQTTLDAVAAAEKQDPAPGGPDYAWAARRRFDQAMGDLAKKERLLIIAGHYEGFDERIIQTPCADRSERRRFRTERRRSGRDGDCGCGRAVAAGALGAEQSAMDETFADGLLEYPQYTRPREFGGMSVPEVLLSGDQGKIAQWRLEQRRLRTQERRPDLWAAYAEKNAGLLAEERARAERKLNRKKRKPGVGGAEPG